VNVDIYERKQDKMQFVIVRAGQSLAGLDPKLVPDEWQLKSSGDEYKEGEYRAGFNVKQILSDIESKGFAFNEVRITSQVTCDVPPLSVAGQFRARGYFNCSA
jgi:hypothetical protein